MAQPMPPMLAPAISPAILTPASIFFSSSLFNVYLLSCRSVGDDRWSTRLIETYDAAAGGERITLSLSCCPSIGCWENGGGRNLGKGLVFAGGCLGKCPPMHCCYAPVAPEACVESRGHP